MIPLFTAYEQPTMAEFNERITQANADVQAAIQEGAAGGIAGAPKIITGSYTGNGNQSKTLNFSSVPYIVFLIGVDQYGTTGTLYAIRNVSEAVTIVPNSSNSYVSVSSSGNSITLSSSQYYNVFNNPDATYRYVAICK